MFNALVKLFEKIPQPYRFIALIVFLAAVLAGIFFLFSQVQSCGYDNAKKDYETQAKAWQNERAILLGKVAERDKEIAQLEDKEAAIIAADQAGKKLDENITAKIDAVTKEAADEAITTDQPTDCSVRADRTCAKLAGLKPPIVINCEVYKRKLCSQ